MLQELIDLIGADHNPNYWSDHAITYAIELVRSLNQQEWDVLAHDWLSFSSVAQTRLAQLLQFGDLTAARRIAVDMIHKASGETLARAVLFCTDIDLHWSELDS